MTTKITTKFFWTAVQKNFSFRTTKQLISLGFLLFIFACNNKPEFALSSFKTSTGWGYVIKKNDKIIIKQSIIPVIQNIKSFETETEALKVGNLVLDKLEHKTSPTITKNDLILLSIKI